MEFGISNQYKFKYLEALKRLKLYKSLYNTFCFFNIFIFEHCYYLQSPDWLIQNWSEKAAIIEIRLQIRKNIDNELVLRRSFKYWKRRLRKFDIVWKEKRERRLKNSIDAQVCSRAKLARLDSCNYCLKCWVIWLLLPQTPRICITRVVAI